MEGRRTDNGSRRESRRRSNDTNSEALGREVSDLRR